MTTVASSKVDRAGTNKAIHSSPNALNILDSSRSSL